MKKLLTTLALFIASYSFAQEVSPYYPVKNRVSDPYDFTSQLTYFDLNYISNNISEFLTYRMAMGVSKTDDSKLMHTGGTYSVEYTDKIAQSVSQKLLFTYNVGQVDKVYTIQSVKITGSKERLIMFYIEFWQTASNFVAPKGNADVSLLTGQDVVKFYFNKGKPYIMVTNGTYKNIADFQEHFTKLKTAN